MRGRKNQLPPDAGAANLDLDLPNRELAKFLDAESIAYLDLLPILRKNRAGPLYRHAVSDIHWTMEGSALSANAVVKWLISTGELTGHPAMTDSR